MNIWLLATIGLLPPFAVSAAMAVRGNFADRLVAIQYETTAAALILVLLTVAFDQPSFLDHALSLVLVTNPGTLLYTWFLERWL
jgi:multisubunit Na+/H+ antiporter MnhF subunit